MLTFPTYLPSLFSLLPSPILSKLVSLSPVTHFPSGIDPRFEIGAGQGVPAQNMVGSLFTGHDRRRIEIAVGNAGEDRRIRYPQPVNADHPCVRVHYRAAVIAMLPALRGFRNKEIMDLSNNAIKHMIKVAINEGLLKRVTRGSHAYYTIDPSKPFHPALTVN